MADAPSNARVDAVQARIDSVRSRLSSLNETLTKTSIERMEQASFATPAVTPIRPTSNATAMSAAQHRSPPPMVAVPSESRWRLQQEMLNKQLDDFRRGGGETMTSQEWAAATSSAAPGSPLSNFAEMQKRLRSKLAAMSVNNAPSYEAASQQADYGYDSEPQYTTAAPPRVAPAAPPSRPEIVPPFSERDVSSARPHQQAPAVPARRAAPQPQRATSPSAPATMREGGDSTLLSNFQSPSLIGGLVSRFAPNGAAPMSEPANAGATNQRPVSPAPSTSRTRGIVSAENRTRTATSPPRVATPTASRAAREATPSTGTQPGTQKVLLTGAEVFAILRMRGVVVSKGATGEHLLPSTQCHEMVLSATELQQLDHLRETLRLQQRNAPRGASARPRTPPSQAGLGGHPPSLRSTEAALAVAEKRTPKATKPVSPPTSRWH